MKKNLINIAKNFLGSKGFSQFFDQAGIDILDNGDKSCAIFISTVLVMTRLIDGVSFTVKGILWRIENSNRFMRINKPSLQKLQKGDIIVWSAISQGGNEHVGIYIGDGMAISNRSALGAPGEHPVIYTGYDRGKEKKADIKCIYRLK